MQREHKPNVIVIVSGGVVQGIGTTRKDVHVDVLDYDDLDESSFLEDWEQPLWLEYQKMKYKY